MPIERYRLGLGVAANSLQEWLPPLAVDLATLAAEVYLADRLTRRPGTSRWVRQIGIDVAVADAEIWNKHRSGLARTLNVLTDDHWDVRFVSPRSMAGPELQRRLFKLESSQPAVLGLFSGGLDSFAGAAAWLDQHPRKKLGLVSIRSSTVIGNLQQEQVRLLKQVFPDRVVHLSVPLNLYRAPDVERTQRCRGFVYAAIASALAHSGGIHRVLVFENGYGAVNPRLAEHQIGSQATKSTHPYILKSISQLLQRIGFEIDIELPFLFCTKAELLQRMPAPTHVGIHLTASCDGFPLRLAHAKQCGKCGSCILRQQAICQAGLQSYDRRDYAESPFEGEALSKRFLLMAYQANQFLGRLTLDALSQASRRWPEITLGDEDLSSPDTLGRVAMLKRYGLEWLSLVEANPRLAAALKWDSAA